MDSKITFSMVDVESVTSSVPLSNFDEDALDTLADMILESGGILKPLVLKKTGFEQYSVVEGHFEYYAAVKAREKNPREGETVNAFIISPENEAAVINQAEILLEQQQTSISQQMRAINEKLGQLSVSLGNALIQQVEKLLEQQQTSINEQMRAINEKLGQLSVSSGDGLIQQVGKLLEQQQTSINEQMRAINEKLDKLILPPKPNLLTATKQEIISVMKDQKKADIVWNALEYWKKEGKTLSWENLKKSINSKQHKIPGFGEALYKKLQEVGYIPPQ